MFIAGWEWLILLAIALLLFGGAKLAGIGKGAGRAIREFKEETRGLNDKDRDALDPNRPTTGTDVDRRLPDTDLDRPIEPERRDG